jgi:hypothetical protein
MRFAIATNAVLAHSLLGVVDSSASATTTTANVKMTETGKLTLQQHGEKRRHAKTLAREQGFLSSNLEVQRQNSLPLKNRKKETFEECTLSSTEPSHADAGVLSCGLGKYCLESSDSSTGGYCVSSNSRMPGRRRQQVVGRLSIIELADLFCNRPEETGLTIECNCTVDFSNFSGEFLCYFGPDCTDVSNGCVEETFPLCGTEQLQATLVGADSYSYTSCYTQTLPLSNERFTYCTEFGYTTTDGPTCDIEVEGVPCNSW